MLVVKRDNTLQDFSREEVLKDVERFLTKNIDTNSLLSELEKGIVDKITTRQISELLANICASRISKHPDYNKLAAALCVVKLHKETSNSYSETISKLYHTEPRLVSKDLYELVQGNKEKIEAVIDYSRDYLFDFFAIKTLERSYLKKIWNKSNEKFYDEDETKTRKDALGHNNEEFKFVHTSRIVERPQDLFMTVSLSIHRNNIDKAFESYYYMSNLMFIHGTPTLFNGGTDREQLSSCYLLDMEDNIESIFKVIGDIAKISKLGGGLGITLSRIRANGSKIKGTNGESNGIIPLCRTINEVCRYINQGGRRSGSCACYLQISHPDIYSFIELRKPTGDELQRARDLFLAVYVCDLFMKRVENDEMWSLICPSQCPQLVDSYGEEFEKLYLQCEKEGKYVKQVKAKDLWMHILENQIETGMPYVTFQEAVNKKSNQKNVGVIKSSNLCNEIVEYYDSENTAVCNLGSVCLPRFVKFNEAGEAWYDYEQLLKVAKVLTRNLDNVIDINHYPIPETKRSNNTLRPIGLGVSGLADVFQMFKVPYGSDTAKQLNKNIFETIYFACITESNQIAKEVGPYSRFEGSPFSKGEFQFHLCGLNEDDLTCPILGKEKWFELKESVMKYGTRNSLLTCCMPTATTSIILNSVTESFEPRTNNLYVRKTLAGSYSLINEYLVKDLEKIGLWTHEIQEEILYDQGSIQNIVEIPKDLKEIYLTAFEMKQRDIIQQSIDRSRFIDQSQSLNLFMAEPSFVKLNSALFFGWKGGLKTGMYYLRSLPSSSASNFGLTSERITEIKQKRLDNGDVESYQSCPIFRNKETGKFEQCESCSG